MPRKPDKRWMCQAWQEGKILIDKFEILAPSLQKAHDLARDRLEHNPRWCEYRIKEIKK